MNYRCGINFEYSDSKFEYSRDYYCIKIISFSLKSIFFTFLKGFLIAVIFAKKCKSDCYFF